MLAHDSYTCKYYPGTIGFPTKREEGVGNFIGSIPGVEGQDKITLEEENECPEECRRKLKWKYC